MTNRKIHDYDRKPRDSYFTIEAPRAVAALAKHRRIEGVVLEPAAGAGHLAVELAKLPNVSVVIACDIEPAADDVERRDLFSLTRDDNVSHVISNLPFDIQDRAIEHLLATYPAAHHAYLVRWNYLVPAKRRHLIHENPRFAGTITFRKRLRWIADSKGSPAVDYCWVLFTPEGAPGLPLHRFE
jgi:hypothetical protein